VSVLPPLAVCTCLFWVFLLLNIKIRSSPVCSRKKSYTENDYLGLARVAEGFVNFSWAGDLELCTRFVTDSQCMLLAFNNHSLKKAFNNHWLNRDVF
jgi:hypothetical protein